MKTLGAEIGIGERQAQKYVVELEKARLIRRVRRFVAGAQTSNAFEFLWHELFGKGANESSGEGVNDNSQGGTNDSSPKESHLEESHLEETKNDIDCLPMNRKNLDSPSGVSEPSVCHPYPTVRERLARYMQLPGEKKEYPSDRQVVDILDAAGTYDEQEVITVLNYLYQQRGLKPFTKHGPNSFAWFKTVLQDYFTKKRDRESAANPSGYHEWEDRNEAKLSKAQFEAMTGAVELPDAGFTR
jgi:hypothetical protein